jgi:hypothetical protein
MLHSIAIYFIAGSMVVTFLLELWTGCAIAGWTGDKSVIERAKSPGPYWFVMALQTTVLVFLLMIASGSFA